MTEYWGIVYVLPSALLKNGIIQDEFVGVSFIVHTQRKYEFWKKTIRFWYTKPDHNSFVNIMSVKSAPFQVLRNMGMVPTGLLKNYIVKTDHQHPYTVLHIGRNTFLLVTQVEHQNEPKRPQQNYATNKFWKLDKSTEEMGFMRSFFHKYTNHHLEKRGSHSLNGLQATIF